jgi:hypothetical protein
MTTIAHNELKNGTNLFILDSSSKVVINVTKKINDTFDIFF